MAAVELDEFAAVLQENAAFADLFWRFRKALWIKKRHTTLQQTHHKTKLQFLGYLPENKFLLFSTPLPTCLSLCMCVACMASTSSTQRSASTLQLLPDCARLFFLHATPPPLSTVSQTPGLGSLFGLSISTLQKQHELKMLRTEPSSTFRLEPGDEIVLRTFGFDLHRVFSWSSVYLGIARGSQWQRLLPLPHPVHVLSTYDLFIVCHTWSPNKLWNFSGQLWQEFPGLSLAASQDQQSETHCQNRLYEDRDDPLRGGLSHRQI